MPAVPRLGFGLVDVRDTVDLHLMAMTRPEASGERFLAVAGPSMTLQVRCPQADEYPASQCTLNLRWAAQLIALHALGALWTACQPLHALGMMNWPTCPCPPVYRDPEDTLTVALVPHNCRSPSCGPACSHAVQDVAKVLKSRMGEAGKRVPTGILPDWVLRLAACFDSSLRQIVPILGKMPQSSNEKAKCGAVLIKATLTTASDPDITLA